MEQLTRRTLLASGSALLSLGPTALLYAQTNAAQGTNLDPVFAAKLLIAGRKQIAVCELALTRLTNEDAKNFAKAEIAEHQDMKQKLAQLGFTYPAGQAANASAGQGGGTGATTGGAAATVSKQGNQQSSLTPQDRRQLQIADEVATQCIDTQKSEMAKLQGKEHDKRFVENQLDAHYDLFDHGVTFRKHASSDLAKSLDEARSVIEKHIATCKELCKALA